THTYLIAGTLTYTVNFVDVGGTAGQVTGTATVPVADLMLTKTGPATADANTDVVYHLVVANSGPQAVQNVHLLDPVPAGMTFVAQGYDPGDPVPSVCNFGATIDCSTGVLALAATFGVTLTFHVNQADADGMVITNTATATSDTFDPNPANNSSSLTVNVIPRIAATGSPLSTVEGATFDGLGGTFTSGDARALPSDFTATITWGDGTASSAGTIAGGTGSFGVSGIHAYAEEGTYAA